VATGALGTGINIEGIMYVVHVDRPYRLTSFVQPSGRGGRNGEVSEFHHHCAGAAQQWVETEGDIECVFGGGGGRGGHDNVHADKHVPAEGVGRIFRPEERRSRLHQHRQRVLTMVQGFVQSRNSMRKSMAESRKPGPSRMGGRSLHGS
jgi:superfamily II DNA/RNA helicase